MVILQNGVSGILVGTGLKTAGFSATVSANGASTQRCAMKRNAFVAIFDAARARGVSSRAESGKGEAREFGAIAPVARSRVRDPMQSVEWPSDRDTAPELGLKGYAQPVPGVFRPLRGSSFVPTGSPTHHRARAIFVKGSNVVSRVTHHLFNSWEQEETAFGRN
eukprot:m.355384 g.355384  ORF g.355384 m.355384 type:complete len:164 (-) comp28012_c0_seq1:103-594(-)